MNIAKESPSRVLKITKGPMPYIWSDGCRGSRYDIGPYQVAYRDGWLCKNDDRCAMLQICREDGGSVFDWRDMQQIKNLVLGPEWEAVELYPSESRLRDPSNARYLWAKSDGFDIGFQGQRLVLDAEHAFAPQRPFGAEENP